MGKFQDTLSEFESSDGLPDDWRDRLSAAYDEDFEGANELYNQTTKDYNDYKTSTDAEIQRLKAKSFELLMNQPKTDSEEDNTEPDRPLSTKDFFRRGNN